MAETLFSIAFVVGVVWVGMTWRDRRRAQRSRRARGLAELHAAMACPKCQQFDLHDLECLNASQSYPGGVYRRAEDQFLALEREVSRLSQRLLEFSQYTD